MSKHCLIIWLNRGPGLGFAAAAAVNSAHSGWLAWSRGKAEPTQNGKVYWLQPSTVYCAAFSGRIEFNQSLKVSEGCSSPSKFLKINLLCCSSSPTSFPAVGKMNTNSFWRSFFRFGGFYHLFPRLFFSLNWIMIIPSACPYGARTLLCLLVSPHFSSSSSFPLRHCKVPTAVTSGNSSYWDIGFPLLQNRVFFLHVLIPRSSPTS